MRNDLPDQNYNRDYNGDQRDGCKSDLSPRCPMAGAWAQ
jgi:hypothetical protein